MNHISAIIGVAILLAGYQTSAAENRGDSDARSKLIGSWIVPKDSSDFQPALALSLETYFADGTEVFSIFRDRACQVLLERHLARWSVRNGVLVTDSAEYGEDKDDIVDISDSSLKLHSQGDDTIYTRVKATNCGDTSN